MKQCSKCKEYYEANLNNFPRDSRTRDGLSSHCKNCVRLYNRKNSLAYYARKKGMTLIEYYKYLEEKFPYKKEDYIEKREELEHKERLKVEPKLIVNGRIF